MDWLVQHPLQPQRTPWLGLESELDEHGSPSETEMTADQVPLPYATTANPRSCASVHPVRWCLNHWHVELHDAIQPFVSLDRPRPEVPDGCTVQTHHPAHVGLATAPAAIDKAGYSLAFCRCACQ